MTRIQEFRFIYRPWNNKFPIHSMVVTIRAKDRKEAELINLNNSHKFFDESCTVTVIEGMVGFRDDE